MTTFNTGNPLGSTDVYDRYDNSENLDNFSNGPLDAYQDRFGVPRQSLQGIRNASQYVPLGPYAAGLNFTAQNQVFSYDAGSGAEFYAPGPSIVLPYTTTGAGAGEIANFRNVGDAVLRQDLAGPDGAELVGYLRGETGAVARAVAEKVAEQVSITDFGAVDDWNGTTGTNCLSAILAIYSAFPSGVQIRLPKTDTGVYLISGSSFKADLTGYTFVPDAGVSLHHVGAFCPVIAKGIMSSLPLQVRMSDLAYTFTIGAEAYRPVSEKRDFMTHADGERPTLSSVNHNFANNWALAWPNGPASAASPAASSSDSTVWGPVSASAWNITTKPLRPGAELSCYLSLPTFAGQLCAVVLTDAGFAMVRQDATGGAYQTAIKSGASALVESGAISTPISAQTNYRFAFSVVSIRVHSPRSFSVLLNGIELCRIPDAGGVILQAGFGAGFATNTNNVSIAGMSLATDVRAMGVLPTKVVVVGDSITDAEVPASWSDYMRQYLSGAGGVQFLDIKNIAESGDTSGMQATTLLATSISGYQYCLIQVGVNDIQTGATAATLIANVTSMVNYCRANGVIPIVGVPTMFYGQAESAGTGNTGQATVNNEKGSPHRATLLRYLASAAVPVNLMTLGDFGAIIPALITTPNADPVVMDNVHPTAYGRMVLGRAWAKALLGEMIPKPDKTISGRPVIADWVTATYGATSLPAYDVQGDTFSLGGPLSAVTDPIPAGTVVMTLPEIYRPAAQVAAAISYAGVSGIPSGVCSVLVSAAGAVSVYGSVAGVRFLYLDGLRWAINK